MTMITISHEAWHLHTFSLIKECYFERNTYSKQHPSFKVYYFYSKKKDKSIDFQIYSNCKTFRRLENISVTFFLTHFL